MFGQAMLSMSMSRYVIVSKSDYGRVDTVASV